MHREDFYYDLPKELIARCPAERRRDSRLLTLSRDSGAVGHGQFMDLLELLEPGDLLVFNNTQVIPARLYGHKESGGKVEILLERLLQNGACLAHVKSSADIICG